MKNKKQEIQTGELQENFFRKGKDEMNIAEFPIASLEKNRKRNEVLRFSDTIYDSSIGTTTERKVLISPSSSQGLPTATDEEVLLGLVQISARTNFQSKTISFTLGELLKILKWSDAGSCYAMLKESLKRWTGVTIHFENSWWDKKRKKWNTEIFHIIDNVSINENEIKDQESGKKKKSSIEVTWNKVIFNSFQAGNIKNLDFDFVINLKTPIAKRIYRYLDKKFYNKEFYESNLELFAFNHVGLSKSYKKPSEIKRKIAKAIAELEEKEFIETASDDKRYSKRADGVWIIKFRKKVTDKKTSINQNTARKSNLKGQGSSRKASPEDLIQLFHSWEKMGTKPENFPGGLEGWEAARKLAEQIRDDNRAKKTKLKDQGSSRKASPEDLIQLFHSWKKAGTKPENFPGGLEGWEAARKLAEQVRDDDAAANE